MSIPETLLSISTVDRFCRLGPKFEGIQGWLHPAEGFALYELAVYGPGTGPVVELGSFMGLSTCWIASGLKERGEGMVHAVDTFAGVVPTILPNCPIQHYGPTFERFENNLRRMDLWHFVVPLKQRSAQAGLEWAGAPVRLLFIDAGHDYADIDADLAAWLPHVAPDGLVAIHDVGVFEDVTKRYEELLREGYAEVAATVSLRVIASKSS